MSPQPIEAFISYSHKDESLRLALDDHLALLKNRRMIDAWHDRRIQPGGNWAQAIDANLASARLVLLLVTPGFFASDYCQSVEFKAAIERAGRDEASLIPVIMKEGDYSGAPFSHLKELPTDGLARGRSVTGKKWKNRDEALRDVTEGIRKQLEALQARRVVQQATRIYEAKSGHAPSEADRQEIGALAQGFGRVVAGRKLLWVDDLPGNNDTEVATLRELGVLVTQSTHSADALQRLQAQPFHLVISDLARAETPGGRIEPTEGFRLLQQMRQQGLHTPLIFYTGWLPADDRRRCIDVATQLGASGVTAGPRELLRWCIGELVRSAALDPEAPFVEVPLYAGPRG